MGGLHVVAAFPPLLYGQTRVTQGNDIPELSHGMKGKGRKRCEGGRICPEFSRPRFPRETDRWAERKKGSIFETQTSRDRLSFSAFAHIWPARLPTASRAVKGHSLSRRLSLRKEREGGRGRRKDVDSLEDQFLLLSPAPPRRWWCTCIFVNNSTSPPPLPARRRRRRRGSSSSFRSLYYASKGKGGKGLPTPFLLAGAPKLGG